MSAWALLRMIQSWRNSLLNVWEGDYDCVWKETETGAALLVLYGDWTEKRSLNKTFKNSSTASAKWGRNRGFDQNLSEHRVCHGAYVRIQYGVQCVGKHCLKRTYLSSLPSLCPIFFSLLSKALATLMVSTGWAWSTSTGWPTRETTSCWWPLRTGRAGRLSQSTPASASSPRRSSTSWGWVVTTVTPGTLWPGTTGNSSLPWTEITTCTQVRH